MKKKIFNVCIAGAIIGLVILNVNVVVDGKTFSYLKLGTITKVLASQSGTESGGDCKSAKEVLTGKQVFVTAVTGTAAMKAGITIGMKWDATWSADIKAGITASSQDAYRIICYANSGSVCCTAIDWTMCATTGCPKAGTYKN
jgi:hypothetical protein